MANTTTAPALIHKLIIIHEKRISIYRQVLHEFLQMKGDLKAIFGRMIEESLTFRKELIARIGSGNDETTDITKDWWEVAKLTGGGSNKLFIAGCAADELAMINAYSAALTTPGIGTDLRDILQRHRQAMKDLHAHIKRYQAAQ